MHRDIAPASLLLDTTLRTLKIADFGLSGQYQRDKSVTQRPGHWHYTALEMASWSTDSTEEEEKSAQDNFPFACDIYSWAYVCSYTFTGHEGTVSLTETLPTVLTRKSVINASFSTFKDLLMAASSADAKKRLKANACEETLKRWQQHFPGLCFFALLRIVPLQFFRVVGICPHHGTIVEPDDNNR